ncbi:hypothetical protein GCM10009625_17530 [Brachybacterium fresconis]
MRTLAGPTGPDGVLTMMLLDGSREAGAERAAGSARAGAAAGTGEHTAYRRAQGGERRWRRVGCGTAGAPAEEDPGPDGEFSPYRPRRTHGSLFLSR